MDHPFFQYDDATREKALSELSMMINTAEDIIANSPFPIEDMYIGHSGGKDSVAVTFIATEFLGEIPVLHSAKPAGENAVHPKALQVVYKLAEDRPVLLYPRDVPPPENYATQIDGTKACEFDRTDGRHTDIMIDGKLVSRKDMTCYVKNGLFGKNFVFPIFNWQDYHVWALIWSNGLDFSDEYLENV